MGFEWHDIWNWAVVERTGAVWMVFDMHSLHWKSIRMIFNFKAENGSGNGSDANFIFTLWVLSASEPDAQRDSFWAAAFYLSAYASPNTIALWIQYPLWNSNNTIEGKNSVKTNDKKPTKMKMKMKNHWLTTLRLEVCLLISFATLGRVQIKNEAD